MQKVTLIGNLGKDPEERATANGNKVTTFSLAVSVKKDVTVWYQINIWEDKMPLFEGILPHLRKGSKVCIIGDLGAPQAFINKSQEPSVKLHVMPLSINFVGLMSQENKVEKTPAGHDPFEDDQIPF